MERASDAIKIFELNVRLFPKYAKGFHRLGDGYIALEDRQNAQKAWKLAVALGFKPTQGKLDNLEKE